MGSYLTGRTIEAGGQSQGLITALPRLAAAKPVRGVALVGRPVALRATVRLSDPGVDGLTLDTAVRAVVQDHAGVRQIVDLGFVPADGEQHLVTADLPGVRVGEDARPGLLSAPLQIVAVQASLVPQIESFDDLISASVGTTLTVRNLRTLGQADLDAEERDGAPDEGSGTAVVVPKAFDWSVFSTGDQPVTPDPVKAGRGAVLLHAGMSAPLGFGFRDIGRTDVTFSRWAATGPLPGIAGQELLDRMHVKVGDQIAVKANGWAFVVDLVGSVPMVPTLDPDRSALVLDQDLLTRALIERGETTDLVDEWWADSPVEAALWLVIVASAAFAAIGFAMHTTVAVRLRRVEFSQLRALGITRRALTWVVATENVLLCVIGVACGVGLGIMLGWLVGPMVALAADGSSPVPSVLVVIPWRAVTLLALEIVAILVVVVLVVTRVLRRSVLGSVLRLGDER
jgi:hypothetical protein